MEERNFGVHEFCSTEFLIKWEGFTNHSIILKQGRELVMLLGISTTFLGCKHLDNHIVEAIVVFGSNVGDNVLIRRMLTDLIRWNKISHQVLEKTIPLGCVMYNDDQ